MALGQLRALGQGRRQSARELLMTPANIARIADRLARMRGAAMKVGQLLSMDSGDVLPPELATIMARLRENADFMPPSQLKQVLGGEWGADWTARFARFDVRPVAAASIGQVHRARLRDGTDLAIKVQYPGVARSIDSDVANVGALIRMTGLVPRGLDLAPYLEAARLQLHEETDYLREARQQARYAALLAGDHRFAVADVRPDLTTPRILAMSWMPGRAMDTLDDQPPDCRDAIARDLIDLTLTELFTHGTVQSDPNFANYRYDPEGQRIVLLDFGATRDIAPEVVARYRALMCAGMAGDGDRIHTAAAALGLFDSTTSAAHRDLVLRLIGMVFARLRDPAPIDFATEDLARRLQADALRLADEGFVPPPLPIDVLYLQRKFGGMFLLAARLRARVAVRDLIARHLSA